MDFADLTKAEIPWFQREQQHGAGLEEAIRESLEFWPDLMGHLHECVRGHAGVAHRYRLILNPGLHRFRIDFGMALEAVGANTKFPDLDAVIIGGLRQNLTSVGK